MSLFSRVHPDNYIVENDLAFAVADTNPLTEGHTLVITKRETPDWFSATRQEREAIVELIDDVKNILDVEFHPDGYHIGTNVGDAAGQTVYHLHVHVIPRYDGDRVGLHGVRDVLPRVGR